MSVVKNSNPTPNSDKYYLHAITMVEGKMIDLLLTDSEAKRAAKRAVKNPEDVPSVGQSWPICPEKERCSFWKRFFGTCS